ncbi:CRISPR-associated helicase Cas3' [Saccharicrinis sp. 156]|uniref:CRISPR-associated helicase Cas3' n=1 Tax=Saccharicrinis sp. 156 TaxID=3417574 RepID=UPI003D32E4E9
MVSHLNIYYSHPQKPLIKHVQGVLANVKKLTNSQLAELVAILHDLGKMNPNFQAKLRPELNNQGYSHHSYLSAIVFYFAFCSTRKNFELLNNLLRDMPKQNDIIAILVLLAKHHGNLPDLSPSDYGNTGASILSKTELGQVFDFLETNESIPFHQFVSQFYNLEDFTSFIIDKSKKDALLNSLYFKSDQNVKPLDFFLKNQHAFACLIHADKADAAKFDNFIDEQKKDIEIFSKIFPNQLNSYLMALKQDSDLNKLRTSIREHAIENMRNGIRKGNRIFELTAPTGSGKTLMMLSLASEIIQNKGAKRIIYGLPFLSITEQVESEVLKIFKGNEQFVQRIDSKSENDRFESIQKELDSNPTQEKILEANVLEFQQNTFAYPFVITTFVRFFETILSNKNAELLKLPNFLNCIFLLDEIQSLPPRLYGFFVAYLNKFCSKFDSYAVISTATQPNFSLPRNNNAALELFPDYKIPYSLLPLSYFNHDLFNRYFVDYNNSPVELKELKDQVLSENKSVLVILNTIDDTKDLFSLLKEDLESEELLLLNTHFTPQHRNLKIYLAKRRLKQKKKLIVISTQLIEAGVDIDFPIVYRDFTTVSSIVQSAGRCNRNGKLDGLGKIILFKLKNKGKLRAELIYRGKDSELLSFTKQSFQQNQYQEKELISVQQDFFYRIQSELNFAKHEQKSPQVKLNFIKDIKECQYDKIGKFRLIDKQAFGEEMQFYVPRKHSDEKFEILLELQSELIDLLKSEADQSLLRLQKNKIRSHLKSMSNQIVQVRLKSGQTKPMLGNEKNYYSLSKIDLNCYSFNYGIKLEGEEFLI